jgi:membrane-associated protease RseP (regulator of RpoE activity)
VTEESAAPAPGGLRRWGLPLVLIALTFVSTTYVGSSMGPEGQPPTLATGLSFALPLMAILLSHEFGHFIAGRRHGVDISPPYFIPMPIFLLGTMGAVIRMRGPIRTRNALLDVGASGPLAGLVVALPVLVYGLWTSPVQALPASGSYFIEGRSVLYLAILHLLKGPIPDGQDVFLTPTALAGWAGLLVTMINLVPVGQLDGGHVAYALFGPRQDRISERVRRALPFLGVAVGLFYGVPAFLAGRHGASLAYEALAGVQWIVWAVMLWVMTRLAGRNHPPTGPEPLSPARRAIAIVTLALFVLLFMPSWIRQQ